MKGKRSRDDRRIGELMGKLLSYELSRLPDEEGFLNRKAKIYDILGTKSKKRNFSKKRNMHMDSTVILQNQRKETNVGRESELLYLSMLETEQDRDRFQKIYEENHLKMYHVVIGILKQQANGENAVHEAFLALAEGFERYAHLKDSEMTGLCITIAKNKAIDILRVKNRYSETDLENLILYDSRKEANPEDAQEAQDGAFNGKGIIYKSCKVVLSDIFTLIIRNASTYGQFLSFPHILFH